LVGYNSTENTGSYSRSTFDGLKNQHEHRLARGARKPEGLKRPDLEATVDGKKIASESQRQLYDDLKRGNCTRCHKGGHIRKDCLEPKAKWEDKFDKEHYWQYFSKIFCIRLLNSKLLLDQRIIGLFGDIVTEFV
jgi:hypothetical protein